MMPIINIHPFSSETEAEAFRLTLKDADKFGLYCLYDGKTAMWSVIPKIACDLIFNAETALPVTERTWVDLTDEETETLIHRFDGDPHTLLDEVNARLKEKNT